MTTNFDTTLQIGADGFIVSEFLLIESFMLETALAPKNDPYTCTIAGPGSYGSELYWMECADIASSTTLSNSIVRAANNTQGGLGTITELNYSATNRFGGEELCPAQDTGELAHVGDGTIDTFDMSVLLWYHFKTPPYDTLPMQPSQVYTTERRIDTRLRCGENYTRGEWKVIVATDYCAAPTASGRRLQVATDPDAENRQMEALTDEELEILEWVRLSSGSWYRIHMAQFDNLASDLILDSLFVSGSVSLNNDPAPDFNCTNEAAGSGCAPEDPGRPHIFYKRALEYDGRIAEAYQCANVLAALTPSEALNGNTLGLRQQPISTACQFDIFIWVPNAFKTSAITNGEKHECYLAAQSPGSIYADFGLQAGSMVLTGEKSRALRQVACARNIYASELSPSPSPPAESPPPPPPTTPGGGGGGDDGAGAAIGVSAGGAVLGLGLCLACFLVAARRRKQQNKPTTACTTSSETSSETKQLLTPSGNAASSASSRGGTTPLKATRLSFSLNAAFEKC